MRYIVMPIEDAKIAFTDKELSTMRKSVDGTEVIVHENILVNRRKVLSITTLPSEDTGTFKWTYPTYEFNSSELDTLLSSDKWLTKDN